MLCYRDRTWCSQTCNNKKCDRNFTDEERDKAIKWWGSVFAPVAFSDFKTDDCGYIEEEIISEDVSQCEWSRVGGDAITDVWGY